MSQTHRLEIDNTNWTQLPDDIASCAFEYTGAGSARYRESEQTPTEDWGHTLSAGQLLNFVQGEGSTLWFRAVYGSGHIIYTVG